MMVTRWGLSEELGTVSYGENQDEVFLGMSVSRTLNASEATVQKIDSEIRRLVEEGYNQATGQWIGRTTQNRMLNFVHPVHTAPKDGETLAGSYWSVRVTRASPNSFAGEAVN